MRGANKKRRRLIKREVAKGGAAAFRFNISRRHRGDLTRAAPIGVFVWKNRRLEDKRTSGLLNVASVGLKGGKINWLFGLQWTLPRFNLKRGTSETLKGGLIINCNPRLFLFNSYNYFSIVRSEFSKGLSRCHLEAA